MDGPELSYFGPNHRLQSLHTELIRAFNFFLLLTLRRQ